MPATPKLPGASGTPSATLIPLEPVAPIIITRMPVPAIVAAITPTSICPSRTPEDPAADKEDQRNDKDGLEKEESAKEEERMPWTIPTVMEREEQVEDERAGDQQKDQPYYYTGKDPASIIVSHFKIVLPKLPLPSGRKNGHSANRRRKAANARISAAIIKLPLVYRPHLSCT